MSETETEVCGSWRVTERLEGYPYRLRWCERRSGPCPFIGTEQGTGDRRCGALPGQQLFVTYGEDKLGAAITDLSRAIESVKDLPDRPTILTDTAYIARSALQACLGDDA